MRSKIVERRDNLKVIRQSVAMQSSESIDKNSYLQMIDMNIEALTDIVTLINYVKNEEAEKVSQWFDRFR